ncbi:DNA cytosine methyltransferase [Rhizorhabdus wittichii]|uniref:DNA cytosine methyltransferase n=1 Tax=Rhizorhabdus wittichii TaxID=160791 RepID=A0A975HBV6_9SPHN|nr:DNA cytosine methyltransferase [Rhizorhabdus wittichii]QTH19815.1 DNA cytosine methyltransferase [Rhizorhabdus wittichii]
MALRPDSLNAISICAGAGGLDLALQLAEPRARTVAYVEREAYAAATLVARMETGELAPALVWSDLGTFDARPFRGRVHLVTSGDPCQPNSVAGRGLGADDERFLIDQVVRVFDESGAHRLFRENVTGNADGQLAAIVPLLEGLGCRVAAGIFSAEGVGASHRRERLVIMADRDGARWAAAGRGRAFDAGRQSQPGSFHLVYATGERRGEGRPEPELRRGRDAAAGAVDGMGDAHGPHVPWGGQAVTRKDGKSRLDMLDWQAEAWPTPGAGDDRGMSAGWESAAARHASDGTNKQMGLRDAAPRWSQPSALGHQTHDGTTSLTPIPFCDPPSDGSISGPLLAEISVYRRWSQRSGGAAGWRGTWTRRPRRQLNVRFAEYLMSSPLGWTDCGSAVTGFTTWLSAMRGLLSTLCSQTPDQPTLL